MEALNLFTFNRFRKLFYLVTPNETTFEKLEDVPDYIDQVCYYIRAVWFSVTFKISHAVSNARNELSMKFLFLFLVPE